MRVFQNILWGWMLLSTGLTAWMGNYRKALVYLAMMMVLAIMTKDRGETE